MQALLSFDQAPPLSGPLRFFVTAPLFGVLAGLLLFVEGPALFASRWMPAALAMTHLLTLGFLVQVMFGALIQILPVMAGANLRRPALTAAVTHAGLTLGTLALAWGFVAGEPRFLTAGAGLLTVAVLIFLLASTYALWGVPSSSPTIRGLKVAFVGLSGVLALGVFLVFALQQGTAFSLPALVDLHAGWGLGGWSAVLLVAISYVVVPMFQLTPGYPARTSWWLPVAIFVLLLLWTLALVIESAMLVRLAKGLLALAGLVFCGLTLRLQAQRRRARADVTHRFWQLGLASGIVALLMLLTAALWPALADLDVWPIGFAIVLVVGGFLSFIIGMLYKIVPFLAWLHLQNQGKGQIPAPTMSKLLADARMQHQFMAHAVALGLLLLATIFPEWLARPAGLGVMLACGWLLFNLLDLVRRYRQCAREIAVKLAAP